MSNNTLLGHLAMGFAAHPENVATAALGYILQRSATARRALSALIGQCGVNVPDTLDYRTQVASNDQTIPDLVGHNEHGREVLLIEAKFWAGLTQNQPCAYLERLGKADPGVLLFVAPELRMEPLWADLLQECRGRFRPGKEKAGPGIRSVTLEGGCCLALTSWRAVSGSLLAALNAEGEADTASDVRQLQGLCDLMDSEGFLPLRLEELGPETARRLIQFNEIVDDAAAALVRKGFAGDKEMKSSSGKNWYGKPLRFGDVVAYLMTATECWVEWRSTPLWLGIYAKDWTRKGLVPIRAKLQSMKRETPSRLFEDAEDPGLFVPMILPTGVDRDAVVRAVVDQINEVARKLA